MHDNPLSFWPIYPGSLRKLFIRAFTVGLHDPDARVMENEWRKEMCALRDAIFYCPHCGAENFFDLELAAAKESARSLLGLPLGCSAIRLACAWAPAYGSQLVMLSRGAQLFAHHLEGDTYNFEHPLAEVVSEPLGLEKSLLGQMDLPEPERLDDRSESQRGAALTADCHIHFGKTEAEVRIS